MMRVEQIFFRDGFHQFAFNFQHGFARGEADAIGYPENMRINRHHGFTKSSIENDVRSLATDAGQRFKCSPIARNHTVVLFDEQATSRNQMPCFAFIQAYALNVFGQFFFSQRQDRFGGIGSTEQNASGEIDAFICGLGG